MERSGVAQAVYDFSACFLKVFGVTKAGKPDVMKVLVDVMQDRDIIAVQEIRDATNTAFRHVCVGCHILQAERSTVALSS